MEGRGGRAWRLRHARSPHYARRAGRPIQQWLYHAESGDDEAAWREIMRENPSADSIPSPRHELAGFDMLNTWYFADAPATPRLDAIRRQGNFAEVQLGLDESNALFEARRCLSCGNCFECDNCYGVCPDNAVIKLVPESATRSITTTARAPDYMCRSAPALQSRWSLSPAEEGGFCTRERNTPLTNQKQFAYIRHAEVGRLFRCMG
jgi:ferredoxin